MTNLAVFQDSTIQEFLRQIAPVRSELDRLILQMLDHDRDKRPQTAAEYARQLRHIEYLYQVAIHGVKKI